MKPTFLLIYILFHNQFMSQEPLSITIKNIKHTSAKVFIAVTTKTPNFPDDQKIVKGFEIDPKGLKEISVIINDLPHGEYAITTFQDIDGDKKLSTNFLGAPKEPFGFSNNFKPRFKGPQWSDCSFQYNTKNSKQEISLIKLF